MSLDTVRQFKRQKMPERGTHWIVKRIWREMNEQRASQEDVAERSGVSSSAMRKWRKNERNPRIIELEAVLNTLGLKLVVRVDDDDIHS